MAKPMFCPYCGDRLPKAGTDKFNTRVCVNENCEAVIMTGEAVNPSHLQAIGPSED